MRVYFTFLLLLVCIVRVSAQNRYIVFGKVFDESRNPIEFASVVLTDKATKKNVAGTTTGADGSFYLKDAKEGEYTLEVSILGYVKYTRDITVKSVVKIGDVILKEDVSTLKEARITASRVDYNISGYEYKLGNVAALKGKDLTDVLKTAPGIMVYDDVTLYGRPVSNVIIDKRKVKMNGDDLVTYLQSFKAEDIEKIEVISNPDVSERYGGTSVKITTKKHSGGFVSASVNSVVGKNAISVSPAANLDYRREKFSLYTNLGYTTLRNDSGQTIEDNWIEKDSTIFNSTTTETRLPRSIRGVLGIGYDISKNDYFSAEVSYANFKRNNDMNTVVEYSNMGVSLGENYRNYKIDNKKPTLSLMYTHKFKDASELKITGDYVGAYTKEDNLFSVSKSGQVERKDESHTENNISTFVGYANYYKKIKRGHSFNVGLRYSYVKNEAVNKDLSFEYNESVLAPFTSYSVNFNKLGFRAAVQAPLADIDGNNYFDFVPNLSVNYFINPNKGHLIGFYYSYNVKRPVISQLNPSYYLGSDNIYVMIGNPDLKSYRVSSYDIGITLFNSLNLSAGYSSSNGEISSYMFSDEDGTIYRTYTNDAKSRDVTAILNFNKRLFEMMAVDLSSYYAFSKSTVRGETSYFNYITCSLRLSMNLPKSFSVGMKASWNSSSKVSFNATIKKPVSLDFNASKRFKRWNLGLDFFDLLDSAKRGKTTIDMNTRTKTVKSNISSRRFAIRASYNFNWGKSRRVVRADTQKNEISSRIGSY